MPQNYNNVDKLIFMRRNKKAAIENTNLLSRQAQEERDEKLSFMEGIDKMWLDNTPRVQFALQEPVNESVRVAYQKMLNNHGSDFR